MLYSSIGVVVNNSSLAQRAGQKFCVWGGGGGGRGGVGGGGEVAGVRGSGFFH